MDALRRILSPAGASLLRALVRQSLGFAVGVGLLSLGGEQQAALAALIEVAVLLAQVAVGAVSTTGTTIGRTEDGTQ